MSSLLLKILIIFVHCRSRYNWKFNAISAKMFGRRNIKGKKVWRKARKNSKAKLHHQLTKQQHEKMVKNVQVTSSIIITIIIIAIIVLI